MMGDGSEDSEEVVNHWDVGRFIYCVAEQIPYDHPAHTKLVEFVNRLQKGNWNCVTFLDELAERLWIELDASMDSDLHPT